MADQYWLKRLKRDRALADRAQAEVEAEVRKALRNQYLQVSRRLDSLYEEAQRRGTLSRTKLWNYAAYRDLEKELRQYSEIGAATQIDAITKACDRVFQDVIGADVEALQRKKFILPYSPRAVIDTAWSGESFSVRIWKNTEELARRIRGEAQQMVMGLKSSSTVKRQLMRDFDVSWKQAERLVDTELSYVLNKAELEDYRRSGFQKVEIICLKVNTCDKCQALNGEIFYLEDAPVLPIHPRCQCSYVQPRAFDQAEVTASGGNLEEVYARKGVKGYGDGAGSGDGAGATTATGSAKLYAPRGIRPSEAAQGSGVIPAEALREKVEKAVNEAARLAEKVSTTFGEMSATAREMHTEAGEMPTAVVEVLKRDQEMLAEDITDHFATEGSPGTGTLIIPEGYNHGKHAAEIDAAKILVREIGGDIELINESRKNQESSADYRWRDKLWELKSPEKLNGLDKLVHKGMHQIAENPGGLVICLPEGVSLNDAEQIVKHRAYRGKMLQLTTIFLQRETLVKVALYTREMRGTPPPGR